MKQKLFNLSMLVITMLVLTNLSSCSTEDGDIQSIDKNGQLLIVKDISPTLDVTTIGKSAKSAKTTNEATIYRFHIRNQDGSEVSADYFVPGSRSQIETQAFIDGGSYMDIAANETGEYTLFEIPCDQDFKINVEERLESDNSVVVATAQAGFRSTTSENFATPVTVPIALKDGLATGTLKLAASMHTETLTHSVVVKTFLSDIDLAGYVTGPVTSGLETTGAPVEESFGFVLTKNADGTISSVPDNSSFAADQTSYMFVSQMWKKGNVAVEVTITNTASGVQESFQSFDCTNIVQPGYDMEVTLESQFMDPEAKAAMTLKVTRKSRTTNEVDVFFVKSL